jgi:hypothetical protein
MTRPARKMTKASMLKRMRLLAVLVSLALPAGMVGCGGGGARVQQQSTTLGQELQDLEAAYKKGIIDEEQYKNLREDVIERYTD